MSPQSANYLRADEAGSGATEVWWTLRQGARGGQVIRGQVLAVYDAVVYLEFPTDDGPRLLAVGRKDLRPGPLLTHVNTPGEFTFDRSALNSESTCWVTVHENEDVPVLELGLGTGTTIRVPTSALSPLPVGQYLPRPEKSALAYDGSIWKASQGLLSWLVATDHEDGLGWLSELQTEFQRGPTPRVSELSAEMINALNRSRSVKPKCTEASRLVGRGPGSTPAGDDLLSGVLVTLYSLGGTHRNRTYQYGNQLLSVAQRQTTIQSVAFLEQAIQGRASAPVMSALCTLLHPSAAAKEDRREAAELVCDVGHTSGTATLAGVLTAILRIAPEILLKK